MANKRLSDLSDDLNSEQPFAVFVVVSLPNGIAATTRAADRGEAGKIGLPGGKVDEGESAVDAAIRESKEEGWEVYNIDYTPIHTEMVEGRLVWWFRAADARPLTDYKEKSRGINPIVVSVDEIANSGFGNGFLQNMFESVGNKIVRLFLESNIKESFSVQPWSFHSSDQYTDYEENDEEFYEFSLNEIDYVAEVDWRINEEYTPPRIVEAIFGIKDESNDIEDFDDNVLINKVDPTDVIATIFDIIMEGLEKRKWNDFILIMSPKFLDGEDEKDALSSRRGSFYIRSVKRLLQRNGYYKIIDSGTKMDDDNEEIIYFIVEGSSDEK